MCADARSRPRCRRPGLRCHAARGPARARCAERRQRSARALHLRRLASSSCRYENRQSEQGAMSALSPKRCAGFAAAFVGEIPGALSHSATRARRRRRCQPLRNADLCGDVAVELGAVISTESPICALDFDRLSDYAGSGTGDRPTARTPSADESQGECVAVPSLAADSHDQSLDGCPTKGAGASDRFITEWNSHRQRRA